ncbi:MAG: N-succinyldiaminopimelate aminotransferase [Pseudohongiellaceae bacterium]|jgi:N-succinyldiaminopimelate aminotransferase
MNSDLKKLHPYPFERLNALKSAITPPADLEHIALSIGEPKHQSPTFVTDALIENISALSNYPSTKGLPELRATIANWASRRFQLKEGALNPEQHILPVNGTREALFAFTQVVINRKNSPLPLVVTPNPFYQIYEGAALLAGAEPYYLACDEKKGFIPDFDSVSEEIWQRCQLLFLCSPGNPTGAVISSEKLQTLIKLADQYNFIIASDECYSELYFDESKPPVGLLQACSDMGRDSFERCVVFHSLSKRSNLPGLRSGFVAGDASIISDFLLYRTYNGCAMPIQHQLASITAWNDEAHVKQNRDLYREKFDAVLAILKGVLEVEKPDAGFYLWAKTPICDKAFSQQLFGQQNVTVLPGQFLGREVNGHNPGQQRIRMALVATLDECIEAAKRIKTFISYL